MTKLEYYLYSILDQIEKGKADIESFRELKDQNPALVEKYKKLLLKFKLNEAEGIDHLTEK